MIKKQASSYVTENPTKTTINPKASKYPASGKDGLKPGQIRESTVSQKWGLAAGMIAYMGFMQPKKKRKEYLIPKDKAAWLEYLVQLVKKKTNIEYLSEKELRKVIIRARPNLAGKKPAYKVDPDSPICLTWTTEQVAEWIQESGFPELKEAIIQNHICGRRLISLDCNALVQIGLTDINEIVKVTSTIRDLIRIPRPNLMRALMRIPPFERYLHRRKYNGKTYDCLSFQQFCKDGGFNYSLLKHNKNAEIPCTCEVRIVPIDVVDDDEDDQEESDQEDLSLINAPTVEFIVRNLVIRDKTVALLIEDIMESIFSDPDSRKYGKPIASSFKDALDNAYDELGRMTSAERLEFATNVANALLDELRRTTEVLNDMQELDKYIKERVSPARVHHLQQCAAEFMENVMPIASLLALGELSLETIFKQQPEIEEQVDEIVDDAEFTINELVPDALDFVNSVIKLARAKVKAMSLPGLSLVDVSSAKSLIIEVLDTMVEESVEISTGILTKELEIISSTSSDFQEPHDDSAQFELYDSQSDYPNISSMEPENESKKDDSMEEKGKRTSMGKQIAMHLGEGQQQQTVGRVTIVKGHPDKHKQPRNQMTLSRVSTASSKSPRHPLSPVDGAHISPRASMPILVRGDTRSTDSRSQTTTISRRVSSGSTFSKYSEQGDQPFHPENNNKQEQTLKKRPVIKESAARLTLKNGTVYDIAGNIIGLAGPKFTILSEDGKMSIGFVDKTHTAYTNEGKMLGKFDIKARRNSILEQVLAEKKAKTILGPDGKTIGTVRVDGKVLSPGGKVIGRMRENGTVTQPDKNILPITGDIFRDDGFPIASIKSGMTVIPKWKGVKNAPGDAVWQKLFRAEAKLIVGDNGVVVGKVQMDGKILDESGEVAGTIRPSGLIMMKNGKPLQIQAKILGEHGKLLGTVVHGVSHVLQGDKGDKDDNARSSDSIDILSADVQQEELDEVGKEMLLRYQAFQGRHDPPSAVERRTNKSRNVTKNQAFDEEWSKAGGELGSSGHENPFPQFAEHQQASHQSAGNQQNSPQNAGHQQLPFQSAGHHQTSPQNAGHQQTYPQNAGHQQPPFQSAGIQQNSPQNAGHQQPPFQSAGNQQNSPQNAGHQQPPFQSAGIQQNSPQNAGHQQPPFQSAGNQQNSPQNAGHQQPPFQSAGNQQNTPQNAGHQQPPFQSAGNQQNSPQNAGHQQPPFQSAGHQQLPFQSAGHHQTSPENAGHQQTSPQNAGHQQTSPQNTGHQQTSPQNDGHYEQFPQSAGHQQPHPQVAEHQEGPSQYNGHHQVFPQTAGHQQPSPQSGGHQQPSSQSGGHQQPSSKTAGPQQASPQSAVRQEGSAQNAEHEQASPQTIGNQPDSRASPTTIKEGSAKANPLLDGFYSIDKTHMHHSDPTKPSENNKTEYKDDQDPEKQKKLSAKQKLDKLQEDWMAQEKIDMERRHQLKLEQEEAERLAKEQQEKAQEENARQIWEDIQRQKSKKKGSSETIITRRSTDVSLIPSDELEKLIKAKEKHKKSLKEIPAETEHLRQMKLKRKQAVEEWARTAEIGDMSDAQNPKPEDLARMVRITADQIVSEVINLALTHMLLEAEAGKNTQEVMNALATIQRPLGSVENDADVFLWRPNLPTYKTVPHIPNSKAGKVTEPLKSALKVTKDKTVVNDKPIKTEEIKGEIKQVTEEILSSAITNRPRPTKAQGEPDSQDKPTIEGANVGQADRKKPEIPQSQIPAGKTEPEHTTNNGHHRHRHHHHEGRHSNKRHSDEPEYEVTRL